MPRTKTTARMSTGGKAYRLALYAKQHSVPSASKDGPKTSAEEAYRAEVKRNMQSRKMSPDTPVKKVPKQPSYRLLVREFSEIRLE